eukprot:SAG11_NODE_1722_length_4374_cov_5.082807_3_plen_248_part_00
MIKWIDAVFGDAFVAYTHLKALCTFVEAVLRYGACCAPSSRPCVSLHFFSPCKHSVRSWRNFRSKTSPPRAPPNTLCGARMKTAEACVVVAGQSCVGEPPLAPRNGPRRRCRRSCPRLPLSAPHRPARRSLGLDGGSPDYASYLVTPLPKKEALVRKLLNQMYGEGKSVRPPAHPPAGRRRQPSPPPPRRPDSSPPSSEPLPCCTCWVDLNRPSRVAAGGRRRAGRHDEQERVLCAPNIGCSVGGVG